MFHRAYFFNNKHVIIPVRPGHNCRGDEISAVTDMKLNLAGLSRSNDGNPTGDIDMSQRCIDNIKYNLVMFGSREIYISDM